MSTNELRYSAEKWRNSQSVLLEAMSSISESSDAVTVDPLGGSGRDYYPSRDQRGGGNSQMARRGSLGGMVRSFFSGRGGR